MPDHLLKLGIDFISAIKELGQILGYHVETELPVQKHLINSPAVDVAWFKEKNNKFPLFIFEIESSATNGMVYNPTKVFSKNNEAFERPLFFFQVVLRGGMNSSRVSDLREQFGKHNYRIYLLKTDERVKFLNDVLEQHRRISQELDIIRLFDFLISTSWLNIDVMALANHIESLEFEKDNGSILSSYVTLAYNYDLMVPVAIQYVKTIHSDFNANLDNVNYSTYLGDSWCFPIHLGLIMANSDDLAIKKKCFDQLKFWQEKSSYMTMIGPHFGLSMDYDQFIIFGAGGLLGLLCALFYEFDLAKKYLAEILILIINRTVESYRVSNLIWLMHISRSIKEGANYYNFALKELKNIGMLSDDILDNPPFFNIDFDGLVVTPKTGYNDFLDYSIFKEKYINNKNSLEELNKITCYLLSSSEFRDDIGAKIIKHL